MPVQSSATPLSITTPVPDENSSRREADACLHCGLPLGDGDDSFCCLGCRAVYRLIRAEGLDRYYRLRAGAGRPVSDLRDGVRDRKWLEPLAERIAAAPAGTSLTLDVQGIHCAACVWLIEELFRREPEGVRALVNPALGRVELAVRAGFDLARWVEAVERFGYRFGPALKDARPSSDGLLLRAGICLALGANAMMFGFALHLGLVEGPVHALLVRLDAVLATAAVAVGGSVFIRSAWRSMRIGVLHLDVPIALGIVLAYAGSLGSFLFAGGRADYLDTVSVFIALMVLGRWLQERVLDRNRRELLADDGIDGLLTRRVREGRVELVGCRSIRAGDELLIAPGDLVPVDAHPIDRAATLTLDWIDGESQPRAFEPGTLAPAGSFNAGRTAVRMSAATDFAASPIVRLLATPRARAADSARSTVWWQHVASGWVVGVLVAAAAALAGWWIATGSALRALEVTTAVLVVTCPCAFGIATPLAYELVQAGLRRNGLFVRSAGFLDRAVSVRRVVFDKTGTLTTGALRLAKPSVLDALSDAERQTLFELASCSSHPKSAAVRRALEDRGLVLRGEAAAAAAVELAGAGVEARPDGHSARLGSPAWAAGLEDSDSDLVFSVDGVARAELDTSEELRPDARAELERLAGDGYETWILSGDARERVTKLAGAVGVPGERAVGGAKPEAKLAWLEAHDRQDTLVVGDGINDSLVVSAAWCSGTPAVDRPFMAARSDFYFTTAGLAPLRRALGAAVRLRAVLRRNLGFAIAYNGVAVAVAWAGWMKPWLAAVAMPSSSIAIVAATAAALGSRSSTWRS